MILMAKSDRGTIEGRYVLVKQVVSRLILHENDFASSIKNDEEPLSGLISAESADASTDLCPSEG
jgi:hypothetical protein